jgi:hypothetical protein
MSAENAPECKPLVLLSTAVADYDLFVQQFKARGHTEDAQECNLFQLIDVVVDMLAATGLNLQQVVASVTKLPYVHFKHTELWQTCHLSGISGRGFLDLDSGVYLHMQHERWVTCLWLCVHAAELEIMCADSPAEHVEILRAAAKCVLEGLEGVYATLSENFKKNKLLAQGTSASAHT